MPRASLRRSPATGATLTTLCPADDVVVAGGTAAFLRPEAAGDGPGCVAPGGDLNGDSDTDDDVVQLSVHASPATNLGRAATALAMSAVCSTSGETCSADADCPSGQTCRPPWLAALVPNGASTEPEV